MIISNTRPPLSTGMSYYIALVHGYELVYICMYMYTHTHTQHRGANSFITNNVADGVSSTEPRAVGNIERLVLQLLPLNLTRG
jgi:hypothetical protein